LGLVGPHLVGGFGSIPSAVMADFLLIRDYWVLDWQLFHPVN